MIDKETTQKLLDMSLDELEEYLEKLEEEHGIQVTQIFTGEDND